MRNLWTAFYMSLRMFTAFPLPDGAWDEDLRKLSTTCLPLVGLALGGIWWGLAALARLWLPEYLAAALIAALPFLMTGFIHLDGFMDTSDAMLSWRERDERLRILKDVHVGSFSVVLLVLLAMFQFAACMSLQDLSPLLFLPLLSRAGSAITVLLVPALGHSEYAAGEEGKLNGQLALLVGALAAVVALLASLTGGVRAFAMVVAVAGSYGLAMRWCVKTLGGMSGDLCGFALTLSELFGLVALAIF